MIPYRVQTPNKTERGGKAKPYLDLQLRTPSLFVGGSANGLGILFVTPRTVVEFRSISNQ